MTIVDQTPALFDISEPGRRRRFAEDRYAPFRVVYSATVPTWRGPMLGVDELDDCLARAYEAWGAKVHGHHFESVMDDYGDPVMHLTEHVADVTVVCESVAQASEIIANMHETALDQMEADHRVFDVRGAQAWRPRPYFAGGAA